MAAKKDDFSVKKISPKLGGERGTRNPYGPTSSHDLVEQMEFLYVSLNKANDISAISPVGFPIVEITLGNHKSSTETLQLNEKREWKQAVFAFDKSKGDVLSVAIKDGNTNPKTLIGKRNFKLSTDIPTRLLPDARLAEQWYSIRNAETGHHMDLLMSVWFGTQADWAYSEAWFADSCDVSASCVTNTRSKLYMAPKLCYVRITIVSGHDLISNDGKRAPSVYVTATLGQHTAKTEAASGSNPTWNRDLILVASEPFDDTVYFKLMDRVDNEHDQCIGRLEKKVSEMTAQKVPGSASAIFYDIEPADKVSPAGDTRRFASRLRMKLYTDQAYHVFDECSLYCSDYRAYTPSLWPAKIGQLEIGILGATGLPLPKEWNDGKDTMDPYVVAKYGNKWARTRTMINNVAPKWNEQYSWDIYERCTVITLGVYDNRQIVGSKDNDVPIGKVRIPLNKLEWDKLYCNSFPILVLGNQGLKKKGELNLAVRCVSAPKTNGWYSAPFRWMLPKAHYKFPLSLLQIEALRVQAVQVTCYNLAKTEPPLRKEVVTDMLKPENKSFSMRKIKAHWDRLSRVGQRCLIYQLIYSAYVLLDKYLISSQIKMWIKAAAGGAFFAAVFCFPEWTLYFLSFSVVVYPFYAAFLVYFVWEVVMRLKRKLGRSWNRNRNETPSSPLILFDMQLARLDSTSLDELFEEFDSIPSTETDFYVLRMRYDRLRKMMEKVMTLIGDIATQCERVEALLSYFNDPFILVCVLFLLLHIPYQIWCFLIIVRLLNFPFLENSMPTAPTNYFRRLPTNAQLMF